MSKLCVGVLCVKEMSVSKSCVRELSVSKLRAQCDRIASGDLCPTKKYPVQSCGETTRKRTTNWSQNRISRRQSQKQNEKLGGKTFQQKISNAKIEKTCGQITIAKNSIATLTRPLHYDVGCPVAKAEKLRMQPRRQTTRHSRCTAICPKKI